MKFSIQLGAYCPTTDYSGKQLFDDVLAQAILCERLGFESVTLTEHHLLNILLMPAPLQFAVKIASATEKLNIMTAVVVLPLHDMRIYAGEVVAADIFTDGRLLLGLGRGAFAFEMSRLGVPLSSSREKFDESVEVLQALLTREEVSWHGKYYEFEPLTIMPRPMRKVPLMMACATAATIEQAARRGFHVQTTPLSDDQAQMMTLIDAFHTGKQKAGDEGHDLTLSLSRVGLLTTSDRDKKRKLELASHYYDQFDNVFTGPGVVKNGIITPLPRKQTLRELEQALMFGSPAEIIDKLKFYDQAGVHRFMLNPNFGAQQSEILETIQAFAEEVMSQFDDTEPEIV
jgi:alkanesulfonate monooxygenase SsuD/methylene tetrahydromethanopterin reductase-like flavin-dependent oxidoreductase (luciferase family)